MDPLNPIPSSAPAMPSRRVPPVDRLPRVTREGDRPRREPSERREGREPPEPDDGGGEDGHIDIRV